MKAVRCGIIGAGRLGLSLAFALRLKGLLSWIGINSEEKRALLAKDFPGADIFLFDEIDTLPDYLFLCVRDAQIAPVAERLSSMNVTMEGCTVLHCSGALGLEALRPCEVKGARIAAAHPFQTFPFPSQRFFQDIAWGVEARDEARDITDLISALDGRPFLFPQDYSGKKTLYHLSAVAASNFLVAAIELAKNFASLAGIPAAEFLSPIIRTSVENSLEKVDSAEFPLSGPIARGDAETIEKHLQALAGLPHLREAYLHAASMTLALTESKKILSSEQYRAILDVLNNSPANTSKFS